MPDRFSDMPSATTVHSIYVFLPSETISQVYAEVFSMELAAELSLNASIEY